MTSKITKMNIVKKLYQPFVVEKIRNTDWNIGTSSPLIVELDTTTVCNLVCPGCISEAIIQTQNIFSGERLLQLGREFKECGIKGVILIGGGEPLAHPSVGKLIEYLGMNDIAIGITTNGTFIDRYLDEIAEFVSWTRVSVDAATNTMFQVLRPTKSGTSEFYHVISNMKNLARKKKGTLGFSFLIRSGVESAGVVSNVHEIFDAAMLAKEIGCDYFEVKPSYNYKDNMVHSLVRYPEHQIHRIKEELLKLETIHDKFFTVAKAITLEDALTGTRHLQKKDYTYCPSTQLRTLVTPLGAFVCPYWRGKENFRIGDPQTTPFAKLWNGAQRMQVESWLNPSKHCAALHCLRHETNLEIFKMISKLKAGKTIDIVEEFDRFI